MNSNRFTLEQVVSAVQELGRGWGPDRDLPPAWDSQGHAVPWKREYGSLATSEGQAAQTTGG